MHERNIGLESQKGHLRRWRRSTLQISGNLQNCYITYIWFLFLVPKTLQMEIICEIFDLILFFDMGP